jgi:hypothetical protein
MQLNVYMDKALHDELTADSLKLTKERGEITTRQDVLKLAHRAWKNLQAEAKAAKKGAAK